MSKYGEKHYKDLFSIDGLAALTDAKTLDRGVIKSIKVVPRYTVTDAGISAGETFDGVLNYLELMGSRSKDVYWRAEADELNRLVTMSNNRPDTGILSDPTPTTATEQEATFLISGPFDCREEQPTLRLGRKAATAEWGAASAFTGTIDVTVEYVRPDILRRVPAMRYHRFNFGSGTQHTLRFPEGTIVGALYLVVGSGGLLSKIRYGDEVEDAASQMARNFDVYKQEAPTASPVEYLDFPGYVVDANGTIEIELSSAATLSAFAASPW